MLFSCCTTFLPCDKIQRWNFLHQILHVAIQRTRKAKQRFCLCFVDVLLSLFVLLDGTQLLYVGDENTIRQAFDIHSEEENCAFLPKIMSRKKQIIPMLSGLWG